MYGAIEFSLVYKHYIHQLPLGHRCLKTTLCKTICQFDIRTVLFLVNIFNVLILIKSKYVGKEIKRFNAGYMTELGDRI